MIKKSNAFVPNNPGEITMTKKEQQEFKEMNDWLNESDNSFDNQIVGEPRTYRDPKGILRYCLNNKIVKESKNKPKEKKKEKEKNLFLTTLYIADEAKKRRR
ncbi:MAG: hypothetical protein COV57_02030 [Candidatus Liptonbacteria bacterium CG11_big_fil_rev_8_21_14_0_20_35_14]|uniref:Uncharacterized protein n=1 Tax=Candidatus Liptonbacteria bacterium CG11_big_fil_rev_8_21_14_0_20_35_14 TaxID=1974634 RepID=A0A2H0N7Q7_9BACT|nr:MAG: hypothetical protein COV57_02030 [Candidatus Liptonbacteria bacterium CG11_big_fil_rev_8_21_14_0_20_35_14]